MEWARSLGGPWRAEGASSAVIQSCLTLCDPMDCNMPSFPIHNQLLELAQRKRQWHPTPVLLPGKSHGQRSLVSYSPWGHKESGMTERLCFHFLFEVCHSFSPKEQASFDSMATVTINSDFYFYF